MSEKLKPCPFCGGHGNLTCMNDADDARERTIAVMCEQCGASSVCLPWVFSSENEVANSWNRRVAPEWTTETPTEPGWYWAIYPDERQRHHAVRIISGAGELWVFDWPYIGRRTIQELCELCRGPFGKIKWQKIADPIPPSE